MIKRLIFNYVLIFALSSLSGCSVLNAVTNTYDDSSLSEEESATIYTQSYLRVFAYKKRGMTAAEDPIGNLKWKSKIPAGMYRLAVSIDKPGLGKSFIPVSLSLNAQKGAKYWIAYDESLGLFSNSWRAAVLENEPPRFYGILEFWKEK